MTACIFGCFRMLRLLTLYICTKFSINFLDKQARQAKRKCFPQPPTSNFCSKPANSGKKLVQFRTALATREAAQNLRKSCFTSFLANVKGQCGAFETKKRQVAADLLSLTFSYTNFACLARIYTTISCGPSCRLSHPFICFISVVQTATAVLRTANFLNL